MAGNRLEDIRVAALMTDGFEELEFTSPRDALVSEGAIVHVISPADRHVQAMHHVHLSGIYSVDVPVDQANPEDYDAVLLAGGVMNGDKLRINEAALNFVRQMDEKDKPIFVICHAPWLLVSAGIVRGRTMTSYHTLKDDMINAGAKWVDEPVVIDENIISSRSPGDLEQFNKAIIDKLLQVKAEKHAHAR